MDLIPNSSSRNIEKGIRYFYSSETVKFCLHPVFVLKLIGKTKTKKSGSLFMPPVGNIQFQVEYFDLVES